MNTNKLIFIIPTLNEEGNIYKLVCKIKKIYCNYQILIIDDNSTDNTRNEIKKSFLQYNIQYLFRDKRMGIGSAHKIGIRYAYKKKFNFAVTLDADGTHNPIYIKRMIEISKKKDTDIVITNRFLSKKSLQDWPINRKILTYSRYYLINLLLNLKLDTSGAFRLYNLNNIKLKDILLAKHNSYSFFWESLFLLSKKKYRIKEIIINLPIRKTGSSKMRLWDIIDSLFYLVKYCIKNLLNINF